MLRRNEPCQGGIICLGQTGTCLSPKFLQAEPSQFHDQTLIEATKQINRILTSLPPDPQGRKPSLLVTNKGILLAWVYHENRPEGNYPVTLDADDATLIKALKLKI